MALALSIGINPDALRVVRHAVCANPICCNPAHLRDGTAADNAADSIADGSIRRGAQINTTKLTQEDVRAIRAARVAGRSGRSLAREYGVSKTTIAHIFQGRSWSWLP